MNPIKTAGRVTNGSALFCADINQYSVTITAMLKCGFVGVFGAFERCMKLLFSLQIHKLKKC